MRLSLKNYLDCNHIFVYWFIIVLTIYIQTASPSVSGGDSGELLAVACRFGTAHPPGYPLYTMLVRVCMEIGKLFHLTPARSANLLNALISTCTSTLLGIVTHKTLFLYYDIDEIGISLLTSSLFTFQPLVWYNAGIAEVFALNNLFAILLVWLALQYFSYKKYLYMSAFICGLGLCNQHTLVLFEIPLILTVFVSSRLWQWPVWKILWTALCFVFGLVPYVYLYLASRFSTDALFMWGDSSTWTGFLHHLMRKDYGTFDLVTDDNEAALKSSGPWAGAQYVFFMYGRSTMFFGMLFFVLGIVSMWYGLFLKKRKNKALSVVLACMFFAYTVFFCWRANIGLKHPLYLHIFERFWMQPLLLFLLIAAIGIGYCLSLTKKLSTPIKTLVCVIIIIFVVAKQYHDADQSSNHLFEDYGREILRTPHNNTIIITQGDAIMGSVMYIRECENYRRDDQVIPLPPNMMTFYWFPDGPMERYLQSKKIEIPRNKQERRWVPQQNGFSLEDFIRVNEARFAIAGAPEIDQDNRDPSWMERYVPVMLPDSISYIYVNKSLVLTPNLDLVVALSETQKKSNQRDHSIQNIRYGVGLPLSPVWAWERMTNALLGTAIHNGFIVQILNILETGTATSNGTSKIKILELLQTKQTTILTDFINTDHEIYDVVAPSSPYVFSYTSGNIADMLELLLPDLDPLRKDSLSKIKASWTYVLHGMEHDKEVFSPYVLHLLQLRRPWMERAIKNAS